jgi:hypothetical protein
MGSAFEQFILKAYDKIILDFFNNVLLNVQEEIMDRWSLMIYMGREKESSDIVVNWSLTYTLTSNLVKQYLKHIYL